MPLILPGNVASALGGAYEVDNSCRFDDGSSACMRQTFSGTATAANKLTLSFWIKRSSFQLGTNTQAILNTETGNLEEMIRFDEYDRLHIFTQNSAGAGTSSVKPSYQFKDPSAWYHIVVGIDTTQSTDTDRFKFWVNGSRLTVFTTTSYISQNYTLRLNTAVEHEFGVRKNGAFLDAYIAELVYIDGQQLDADQFGEYDDDSPRIWKPIDISGLTFGNNGFYCDFADSGDLGDDESGNGNDFTEAGLAATDQTTDTPTNNFCVLNPLDNYYQSATFSEGNCKLLTAGSSNTAPTTATFGLTAGKWYWEAKFVSDSQGSSYAVIGIEGNQVTGALDALLEGANVSYGLYLNDGKIWTNNSSNDHGAHVDLNSIIGVGLDLDNNRIYFSKDGNWGDGSGNWDESTPNNFLAVTDPASVPLDAYFPAHGDWSSGTIGWEVNFGNPVHSISSGNSDANGYGNFEFSVPSGYLALCTKNLGSNGG